MGAPVARRRFVLRYRGQGDKPAADLERIRHLPEAHVVDDSSRMVLVESDEEPLLRLVESLPDWVAAPERTFAVPDTRKKIRRPPK